MSILVIGWQMRTGNGQPLQFIVCDVASVEAVIHGSVGRPIHTIAPAAATYLTQDGATMGTAHCPTNERNTHDSISALFHVQMATMANRANINHETLAIAPSDNRAAQIKQQI